MTEEAKKLGNEGVFNNEETHYPELGMPYTSGSKGITKREYFAGLAMQGILDNPNTKPTNENAIIIAKFATFYADMLLEELSKNE